jgi:hypothetical protein
MTPVSNQQEIGRGRWRIRKGLDMVEKGYDHECQVDKRSFHHLDIIGNEGLAG